MRGRGKNSKSVHALFRSPRVSLGTGHHYVDSRLQKIIEKERENLGGLYSNNQSARKILDQLDKSAKGLQRDLPYGLFTALPTPTQTYLNYIIDENKWMMNTLTSSKIDERYPATLLAVRAEVRSWILDPRTVLHVTNDLAKAVAWQEKHLDYLKSALISHPKRHAAWGLYKLLARQNHGTSKPREDAVKLAQQELARIQMMLDNYKAKAPFLLSLAYQGIIGRRYQGEIEREAVKIAWQEAASGDIAGMDEFCATWKLTQDKIIDGANVKATKEEFKAAGRYFTYIATHDRAREVVWPYENWQEQLDKETTSLIAGPLASDLTKYVDAQINYSPPVFQMLEPVTTLEKARMTAQLFTQAPSVYDSTNPYAIQKGSPIAESFYTMPATTSAFCEALKDPFAVVDIHIESRNIYPNNKKITTHHGLARATMRHELPDGTCHTIILEMPLGQSKKKDLAKAEIEILEDQNWIHENKYNPNLNLPHQAGDKLEIIKTGLSKTIAPKDFDGFRKHAVEQISTTYSQKPVRKITSLDELIPTRQCSHENTRWESNEEPHYSKAKRRYQQHCLDCNHPRVKTAWSHQLKPKRQQINQNINDGHNGEALSDFEQYNAYLLATNQIKKPYSSVKELLEKEPVLYQD